MKYVYFKIFKFSTVLKKINHIKDSFLKRFYKNIQAIPNQIFHIFKYFIHNMFLVIHKGIKLIINHVFKIYKIFSLKYLNYSVIYKYFNLKKINLNKIYKKKNTINYKNIIFYLFLFLTFSSFLYLMVPFFYDYNKSEIEKVICKKQNIECSIKGEVGYSFLPTPRIIITNIVVRDSINKANIFAKIENTTIKLAITNLLNNQNKNFKKIELKKLTVNFNLNNLTKYKKFFKNQKNFIPLNFTKGKIKFLDDITQVATITNANMNLIFNESSARAVLKGKFLEDNIYISYDNNIQKDIPSSDIVLKMSNLNLLTKINLFNSNKEKNSINGKILVKKNKNKLTAIFDYKNNEIIIKKSNLRNVFLDGKLDGSIKFLPYFDFNLDLNLNSVNFARLYSYLLTLKDQSKKNLFKINKKINGKLNLSVEKIYAKYNLIDSVESRVKFNNGDILIEQLLINLGKLGAADLLGSIKNSKNNTNLKFESNLYIDDKKKFLNKFGVSNKLKISPNLFVSGNFDLVDLRTSLYEIYDDKKFTKEDVDYIENEFNTFMLEEGYLSLFSFLKLKEFVKLTIEETN